MVDGCFWGKLKYKEASKGEITDDKPTNIKMFAQRDVAATFLYGIDPGLKEKVTNEFQRIITESYGDENIQSIDGIPVTPTDKDWAKRQVYKDFVKWLDDTTYFVYAKPIIQSVNFLSKKEMSQLAESLINLTSLRKRVSLDTAETVGGPVDVAIISKGEGLIWINRKHYFDMAFNPHYDGTK